MTCRAPTPTGYVGDPPVVNQPDEARTEAEPAKAPPLPQDREVTVAEDQAGDAETTAGESDPAEAIPG